MWMVSQQWIDDINHELHPNAKVVPVWDGSWTVDWHCNNCGAWRTLQYPNVDQAALFGRLYREVVCGCPPIEQV